MNLTENSVAKLKNLAKLINKDLLWQKNMEYN